MDSANQPKVLYDNPSPVNKMQRLKALKYFLILILIVGVVAGLVYYFKPIVSTYLRKQQETKVIAQVGKETLYQKNLDEEMDQQPLKDASVQKLVFERMINDSVALQAAQEEKLLTIDPTGFNTLNMNLTKRAAMVQEIKTAVEKQSHQIAGTMVGVWFLNTHVSPLGLEASKKIALDKITPLQRAVKAKQMTIQQAADQIKNDSNLAKIDPSYKANALASFVGLPGQPITRNKNFDDAIWKLRVGEVSNIFTVRSENLDNGGKLEDAYFAFAQVESTTAPAGNESFDQWLKTKKGSYEIKTY